MKYNVGDVVVIRPDLTDGVRYGSTDAVEDMQKYRGQDMTIQEIEGAIDMVGYRMEEDNGDWLWTDEMFTSSNEGCDCCQGDDALFYQDNENCAFVDSKGEVLTLIGGKTLRYKVKRCPNCGKIFVS